MSPSGLHINKPAVIIIIGLISTVIFWYSYTSKSTTEQVETVSESGNMAVTEAMMKIMKDEPVPKEQTKDAGEGISLVYREVKPEGSKLDVLFLHGQAFEAKTWVSEPVFTLQLLNKVGYRAVALDLPGDKWKSKKPEKMENDVFLAKAITSLGLTKPVIVSPSMSGGFSLPFLFKDPSKVQEKSRGFVPVAPVNTEKYLDQYKSAHIPTMIIYGETDATLGKESLKNLKNLPNVTVIEELKGAGHACYMNSSLEFNKKLVDFLQSLK
ncbi:putative protein-lysine deacylase ABHD14B isoform X2 [Dreissena polymorpha]|uniref:AB hydrolase-1 domain-containing protein n=1 Tax=Dreissena polymorpha TaxID=45954 RepID=A0A9D4FJ73_DREPO|nr:putative protein-lysine deacylase ABHD14B isoform X2 [Dreissena polymorpha]KAH3798208.1 hypothetical protein DPMN_151802 [Dreissena polymorpha]